MSHFLSANQTSRPRIKLGPLDALPKEIRARTEAFSASYIAPGNILESREDYQIPKPNPPHLSLNGDEPPSEHHIANLLTKNKRSGVNNPCLLINDTGERGRRFGVNGRKAFALRLSKRGEGKMPQHRKQWKRKRE